MENSKICPNCNRHTDPAHNHCPNCGYPLAAVQAGPVSPPSPPGNPADACRGPDPGDTADAILLSTRPEKMSFIIKYLLAAMPVYLVIACIAARWILYDMFHTASSAISSSLPSLLPGDVAGNPNFMNQYNGAIGQYSGGINDSAMIAILFIAPVGIFLFIIAIGWALRITEMWTGPLITLAMSGIIALVLANGATGPEMSWGYITLLLKWIAFLVQPFSVAATVIVLAMTDKFRQSIRYTITRDGVSIRGGVWKTQEHMIPHHLIGRVVMEQDFLGVRYNYGTVIPLSIARWGSEMSIRGIGATGQKDNIGLGIGYAKGREEASRQPLDCLFGIPDPHKARQILETFICRPTMRDEEQLAYLKKIYESRGGRL